jgi:Domain of unknown function (DUF4395)
MKGSALLSFPNPVDEVAARTVAAGVVLMSATTVVLSLTTGREWLWLSVAIAYGFLARVLTGPTLSPLGQLATRVIAPWIGRPHRVPGPPKRFAQGMGATFSLAAVLATALHHDTTARLLLVALFVAAVLESAFAVCLGCHAFAALMRMGVIPASVCEECADITRRRDPVPVARGAATAATRA